MITLILKIYFLRAIQVYGKTFMSNCIAKELLKKGKTVLYQTAPVLLESVIDYKMGKQKNTSENIYKSILETDLLIIDELSYIKMDIEKESLFFQIIRQRYEKNSLIITTNLPMGRWDELFTGQLAATAILDRLLHHCNVLSITGESYRVKGSKLSVKNKK